MDTSPKEFYFLDLKVQLKLNRIQTGSRKVVTSFGRVLHFMFAALHCVLKNLKSAKVLILKQALRAPRISPTGPQCNQPWLN